MSQFFTVSSGGGGGGVTSITGNTGGAQTGAIHLITANSTPIFAGSAGTITLDFGLTNLLIGSPGSSITSTTNNVCLGNTAGSSLNSGGGFNTFIGNTCAPSSDGQTNTAVGSFSMFSSGAGNNSNVAIGASSFFAATTSCEDNVAIGTSALSSVTSGANFNIAVGAGAGGSYTTSESNNICIGNSGVVGESGVTRIGTNATQTSCFVTGIDGVNVGSVATVVTEAGDQLGTAVITAGTGITITPSANTITITNSGVGGSPVAFFATLNADSNGVTGSGTDYVLSFDSIQFNDGGGFSGTDFTAPVTGRYLFTYSFYMQGVISANSSGFTQLRTPVGDFQNNEFNPYLQGFTGNGYFLGNYTNIVQLTSGQSVTCAIRVFGNATDNINLVGLSTTGGFATSFSGFLIQ